MTGPELRAIRHLLGLTQHAFAERIGTVQGHIGDMELERRPILTATAAKAQSLIEVPTHMCGRCLCIIAHGICGCREAA